MNRLKLWAQQWINLFIVKTKNSSLQHFLFKICSTCTRSVRKRNFKWHINHLTWVPVCYDHIQIIKHLGAISHELFISKYVPARNITGICNHGYLCYQHTAKRQSLDRTTVLLEMRFQGSTYLNCNSSRATCIYLSIWF